MPQDLSQMAQMLSMLQMVADKSNPLNKSLAPGMGTEGGGRVGNARANVQPGLYGPYGPPKGQETYNDQFKVFSKESPWEPPFKMQSYDPKSDARLQGYLKSGSSERVESAAAQRGAKFDKRVEALETEGGIFVTLKPGYTIPGHGGSFGADSLKEVREMLKSVVKEGK
jgi:hypothetical protein